MRVNCYPQAGKPKSLDICKAFAEGCGGSVAQGATKPLDGASFFYGINPSNENVWRDARHGQFYYADNAYFDCSRQSSFRVTKNRLQHDGRGESNGKRFAALGVGLGPWVHGSHIVLCPQSDHFMRVVAGYYDHWTVRTVSQLERISGRQVRIREWSRDKASIANTLDMDLIGAHALVTWSSAAAVTAIMQGVPAVSMGESAASVVGTSLESIEEPNMPSDDERLRWAAVLADNQWTLAEFKDATAWTALNS